MLTICQEGTKSYTYFNPYQSLQTMGKVLLLLPLYNSEETELQKDSEACAGPNI